VSDDFAEFAEERRNALRDMVANETLTSSAAAFVTEGAVSRYPHGFDWLGLPILQFPQDIVAVQDLIWRIRPRAVVETGVARGGSLALFRGKIGCVPLIFLLPPRDLFL